MEQLLNKEQLELCHVLSLALDNKKLERLDPMVDYAHVMVIAERHKVTSLLYPALAESGLPENIWNIVDRKAEQIVRQSYRLLMLDRYVINTLQEHGIDAILLKGCGTAAWYPVPELRKSGDVDLLLKTKEEASRALRILVENGFTEAKEQLSQHHIVCNSPDHIEIELHTTLTEPFDSEKVNQFLAERQKEYFTHRREVNVMGVPFQLTADAYHAFYLLLHMLHHYLRAGFGIKLLCDWVVFWKKDLSEEEKQTFLRLVQGSGLLGFAQMMTQVCVRYLGMKEEHMKFLFRANDELKSGKKLDLTEELMLEIFEAEEFGRSSSDRMVTLRGTKVTDYMREFHHQMKLTYPKAGRIVVLYPALWIMTLYGFLHRNRTLRKVSGRQILKNAKKRGRITEQMRLFR